ncbi:MAG: leucine-rich repeat domain-containing protein [Tindallia sp. MSAO_Bac2]|nr:MAG: leucine-rich repeat domain-containing protein [Tindallia sp. MSAO_Bac2]
MNISIPDTYFEMALLNALKQKSGPVTKEQLSSLKVLRAWEREIKNIEGIQYCTGLQELFLGYNYIEDISPLKELDQIKELYLNGNFIKDLAPLSGYRHLEILNVSHNQISSFQPVQHLLDNPSCKVYYSHNPVKE